jgi:holo-[acyl-carrier protein] synthase
VIISTGIDIIEVHRVRQAIERTPRFLLRVFTVAEREYCDRAGANAFAHYAARFAAKEAAMKALGTGWSNGIAWHDVEVARTERGAPQLILRNRAHEIFASTGATRAHLSISHTREHAVAHVTFEAM